MASQSESGRSRACGPENSIKFSISGLLSSRRSSTADTGRGPLLATLSLGHLAIHWYQQLWPVIIPSVKASLGLSDIQLGTLSTMRQFSSGPTMLPAGILADFFRSRTAIILALAFVFLAVSQFLVAEASTYRWIIPGVVMMGIANALWHPAAIGSISLRFPDKRGSALAVHGVGASIGDTVGPIAIGAILLVMAWQDLLRLHVIPALILGVLLLRGLWSAYKADEGRRPSVKSYLSDAKSMLRHRVVMVTIAVNALTGMARLSVVTFLPVYIQDDLEYSTLGLGVFWGLLHVMGAVSQPVMGYLSDKFGRKPVLLPSLVSFSLLYFALSAAGPGIQLVLVVGALGLFFYALNSLTMATMMDVAKSSVQSSTMGISSIFTQGLALPSPIIAGVFVTRFGTSSAFLYAGAVTMLAALILAAYRMPRPSKEAAGPEG